MLPRSILGGGVVAVPLICPGVGGGGWERICVWEYWHMELAAYEHHSLLSWVAEIVLHGIRNMEVRGEGTRLDCAESGSYGLHRPSTTLT